VGECRATGGGEDDCNCIVSCRNECEEQHGEAAVQAYIASGCKSGVDEPTEPPRESQCGGSCLHVVYGKDCSDGQWGGGESFVQVCENGRNVARHYEKADCQGAKVNEWVEDSDCQRKATETSANGTILYESKWCDGEEPVRSLCTEKG